MKRRSSRRYLPVVLILFLALGLFPLLSCTSQSQTSSFCNAGAADFTPTGDEFVQYLLFRFDTADSEHTLTTPSAADIVAAYSGTVGEVLIFVVAADGANTVTISGGTNVTVKASASTVAANSTLMIYCLLDNVSSDSEAVTIY